MTGSIYLDVTGSICSCSALGGRSAPGFQVSHTLPGKSNHENPHVMRHQSGWLIGELCTTVQQKLDWDFCLLLSP